MLISVNTEHPAVLPVVMGIISYCLCNHFEPRSMLSYFMLMLGVPTVLAVALRESYNTFGSTVFLVYPIYLSSLVVSVIFYRLSPFHPLARYPGPLPCKISRLWAWHVARQGHQHLYYHNLHQRYGTHVRTGPNHLHIRDATAVPLVLGQKGFHKGGRYDVYRLTNSRGSLLHITDPGEHAQRRRLWENAFTTSALKGYQGSLTERVDQLVSRLQGPQGENDLSQWLSFFSFDFMGDLSFGGAFNLIQHGEDKEGYLSQAKDNIRGIELVGTIPWLKPFVTLGMKARGLSSFHLFAKDCVLARQVKGSSFKDLFYYLLNEDEKSHERLPMATIIADASLLIIAGSDTTGTALSNLFFYLISHPKAYARLRKEVDEASSSHSNILDSGVLAEMQYLNAVINETLRLQPGVPNGVQRIPPPGNRGTLIAGCWVPPSTTVQTSTYSVHRDPRYFFPHPDSFWPGRWLPVPDEQTEDFRLDRSAFFPFSFGPTGCVGKNLAILEMRVVTAALVRKFVFEFAPSWDPGNWEKQLTDTYVLTKGSMPIIVSLRE